MNSPPRKSARTSGPARGPVKTKRLTRDILRHQALPRKRRAGNWSAEHAHMNVSVIGDPPMNTRIEACPSLSRRVKRRGSRGVIVFASPDKAHITTPKLD